MARALFVVPPLTGHIYPALSVADALTQSGHQVAWAMQAGPQASELPAGTPLFPLQMQAAAAPDLGPQGVRGIESVQGFYLDYAIPMARQCLESLLAAVQTFRPDILVVDHQMLAGALVARQLGLPWVTLATSSASIQKVFPQFDSWVNEQLLGLQAEVLPAERRVERPDFSPYGVIVFSIETLVGRDWPRYAASYHFVGATRGEGRRTVDFPWSWLRDDHRKLFVTLGTINHADGARFFEVVMAALGDMQQVQAVLVAPAALAAHAPDNVLVCQQVPQIELLGAMDAVICHAGHNTVCESLSQGRPLIVSPIRHDQPAIAKQVVNCGAGMFLRYGKATPQATRSAIERLLSDRHYTDRARELAAEFRAAPGAAGAAAIIADVLKTARGPERPHSERGG